MTKRSRQAACVGSVAALAWVAAMVASASSVTGQSAAIATAKPVVFDVATIKPNETGSGSVSIDWNDATFRATNVSMGMLLENGFGIREDLVNGLPGWAKSARYDIVAKAVDTDPAVLKNLTREQRRAMMNQLVVERFHLKTHIEVKQLPVYDLVAGKDGIKFQASKTDPDSDDCGNMRTRNTDMIAACIPMRDLTQFLARQVERTVIDKTGLPAEGRYDFHLKWRREHDGPLTDADAELPSIFTALQEQLGLKLESSKGPVDTLVIDQVEKPTEN